MRLPEIWPALLLLATCIQCGGCDGILGDGEGAAVASDGPPAPDHDSQNRDDLDEWVVHVPKGHEAARQFALEHDLELLAEVVPGSNEFHVSAAAAAAKNGRNHLDRDKRSVNIHRNHHHRDEHRSSDELPEPTMADPHYIEKRILRHKDVHWAERQAAKRRTKRDNSDYQLIDQLSFSDPFWHKMWYINRPNDFNMNVEEAWRLGVSGRGVSVTILDDGVEKGHPDLIDNYDPLASTDINDNDSDPQPRYDFSDSNRHGTRCAGQVAAASNNSLCAVGIAYNAGIGGIRMLDGQVSDAVEARSLSFNPDHVDIYSSSWGPNDDGKTVDGPGRLATRAFINGITRGRDGKGSIFVWASGNGGRYKDNCNCDGYATSIYTITVSSTSESGNIPWYSEACSSTLATTYSSGTTAEKQIVTTDLHDACTVRHTGTSASAPMAAAIIALTLEANPGLSWRDVQHIVVKTARPLNLKAPDWSSNALGRKISHSFGYGLMDTGAMVKAAKTWNNVPKQEKCEVHTPYYYKIIPAMGYTTIALQVNECTGIKSLEHVVAKIHVSAGKKRGDLKIILTSPSGTRSVLLDNRPHDYTSSAFVDWPFMSVHSWGEDPTGTWKLEIHNNAYTKWQSDAKFYRMALVLYGIKFDPNTEEYRQRQRELRRLREERERQEALSNLGLGPGGGPLRRRAGLWPLNSNATGAVSNSNPKKFDFDSLRPRINDINAAAAASSNFGKGQQPKQQQQLQSGCISKTLECTQNVEQCRTFTHRMVALLFCKCSQICSEIAATVEAGTAAAAFNLQCSFVRRRRPQESDDSDREAEVRKKEVTVIPGKSPPVYCSFIPFFSYI